MHFNRINPNVAYFLRTVREQQGKQADISKFLSYSYDKKFKAAVSAIFYCGLEAEIVDLLSRTERCRKRRIALCMVGGGSSSEHLSQLGIRSQRVFARG